MTPLRLCLAAAAAALAACTSTNPPLIFGDRTTIGLHLGNDTASGGASVSLGYKERSVAVVPVSTLDNDGKAVPLKGKSSDSDRDTLSVFAVFEASARDKPPTPADSVGVGHLFSTGLAAQRLTMGYRCRLAGDTECKPTAEDLAAQRVPRERKASGRQQAPSADGDRPFQRPLIFAKSDVYGFDIGGSRTEQGMQFTLGYSTRNLALVPVVAIGAGGQVTRLTGDGEDALDSFSVLGQFKSDTRTGRLGFGLERYFATGIAARNLANGLQEDIASNGKKANVQATSDKPVKTAASE